MISFTKPCDECGGTGTDDVRCQSLNCEQGCWPCPSCVGGWLPDDETVEAAGRSMQLRWESDRDDGEEPYLWDDLANSDRQFWLTWALETLVAAARYQSEEKP